MIGVGCQPAGMGRMLLRAGIVGVELGVPSGRRPEGIPVHGSGVSSINSRQCSVARAMYFFTELTLTSRRPAISV